MVKRYRRRTPKPGQLIAYYGKLEYEDPSTVYDGGDGVKSADLHLIHSMFYGFEHRKDPRKFIEHDGYLEELKARGYDLTTLKFSIEKKKE